MSDRNMRQYRARGVDFGSLLHDVVGKGGNGLLRGRGSTKVFPKTTDCVDVKKLLFSFFDKRALGRPTNKNLNVRLSPAKRT